MPYFAFELISKAAILFIFNGGILLYISFSEDFFYSSFTRLKRTPCLQAFSSKKKLLSQACFGLELFSIFFWPLECLWPSSAQTNISNRFQAKTTLLH